MEAYNPLNKRELAQSVVRALLEQEIHSLPPDEKFQGAGLYALYYTGPFEAYKILSEHNRDYQWAAPIYVGCAVPEGSRKGSCEPDGAVGTKLFLRLKDHANSIKAAVNLEIADFGCRYLVVDDIFISLGESLLIDEYQPVWNVVVDGFGSKDVGRRRHTQFRSAWDMIHPGRHWAEHQPVAQQSSEAILERVSNHLSAH
jgi:hypothetical protein